MNGNKFTAFLLFVTLLNNNINNDNMKHKLTFFAIMMMAAYMPKTACAYDFSAVAPSGQTLYYNLVNGHAEVVRPGTGSSYNNYVAGNLIIPDSVQFNGQTYPVTSLSSIPYGYGGQYGTFQGCNVLLSITIPATITSIGEYAFYDCNMLSTTNYTGSIAQWCAINFEGYFSNGANPLTKSHSLKINNVTITDLVIPEGVTEIKRHAFSGWTDLLSLSLPNSLLSIGHGAFAYCSHLTSIAVPEGVSIIDKATFSGCSNLATITLPSTITYIDSAAFRDCNSITDIISLSSVAPTLCYTYSPDDPYYNIFYGIISSAKIHIPCGSIPSYSSSWTYFFDFDEIGSYSLDVSSSDPTKGQVIVVTEPTCQNPSTIVYASASSNCIFVGWSDGNIENPRVLTLTSDTSIVGYFYPNAIQENDTIILRDTIVFTDTLTLTEYISVHDTIYIDIHDTTYIDVPYAVHDTTYITLTDTVTNTIYDTITNTVYDTVTNTVYDTIDNFVFDTLAVRDTLWLTQIDTLWLHDTVIIHDTVYITQEGVDGVEAMNAKVYSSNGQIVVDGAAGNIVWLYDVNGCVLATKQDEYMPLRFDAPASGTYLIKIGYHPARKVVVIR